MSKPTILVILDGFGYSQEKKYNAIAQAHTPTLDYLLAHYPHALLHASGESVGLLPNYIGNSQVGHTTIGAGKIIKQPVTQIHESIENNSFFTNPILQKKLTQLKNSEHTLHIMGLLSDAGVHSHIKHLFAFITAAHDIGIQNIIIHPFLDGRDVPPKSAEKYLRELSEKIKNLKGVEIGSLHGRYYAMDRDKNWDRTEASVQALTIPGTHTQNSWQEILEKYYAQNITDEFIPPTQLEQTRAIKPGDGIIFINFRPDRARQLTKKLLTHNPAFIITPVPYNNNLQTTALFEKPKITNTLLDKLHAQNKTVFLIAETEKYAHITYFLSGGRENKLPNETRILVPSIPAKNYIDHPCMSAQEITKHVLDSLKNSPKDFYIINYANADMVGHSGDLPATIKAIECLDTQLKKLYETVVEKLDGTLYITSDHGNAEIMFDEQTNQPHTAHTTNPVYFIAVKKELKDSGQTLKLTQLTDIAPFIV